MIYGFHFDSINNMYICSKCGYRTKYVLSSCATLNCPQCGNPFFVFENTDFGSTVENVEVIDD